MQKWSARDTILATKKAVMNHITIFIAVALASFCSWKICMVMQLYYLSFCQIIYRTFAHWTKRAISNQHVHNTFAKRNLNIFFDMHIQRKLGNITLIEKSDFRRI